MLTRPAHLRPSQRLQTYVKAKAEAIVATSSSAMAERRRELGDFKKARVNGGTDNHSLKGFSQVSPLPLTDPHDMVIK